MADLAAQVAELERRLRILEGNRSTRDTELDYRLGKISAHDAWQDSEADNVAAGYPLVLKLYVPEGNDTRHIQQVLLNIWLEAFRSYGTSAASADLGTVSISTNTTGQSSSTTTGPSSITTTGPSSITTTGPSSSSTTSETAHYHADEFGTTSNDGTGMHSHYVPIHNTYTSGAHAHNMVHTHSLDHTHSLAHTHAIDHSHTLGSHSHALAHGIYVGTTASGCTININGTDRTLALVGAASFSADQLNLDATQYITRGLNTISISSATLGRIRAMAYVSLYLNTGR